MIDEPEETLSLPLSGFLLVSVTTVEASLELRLNQPPDHECRVYFSAARLFYRERRCATVHNQAESQEDGRRYVEGSLGATVLRCWAHFGTGALELELDDGFRIEALSAWPDGWRVEGPPPLMLIGRPGGEIERLDEGR